MQTSEPSRELSLAHARIVALEADLLAAKSERDTLRAAYNALKLELELMKRRLFIAKAERVDVAQLELEFAAKLAQLDALSKRLEPIPEALMPATPPERLFVGAARVPRSTGSGTARAGELVLTL